MRVEGDRGVDVDGRGVDTGRFPWSNGMMVRDGRGVSLISCNAVKTTSSGLICVFPSSKRSLHTHPILINLKNLYIEKFSTTECPYEGVSALQSFKLSTYLRQGKQRRRVR